MSNVVTIHAASPFARSDACKAWCDANGIPWRDTYRIDIDPDAMGDAMGDAITVYQYDRDAEGHLYRDPSNPDRVAELPAITLPLRSLPDVLDVLRAVEHTRTAHERYWRERRAERTEQR